MRLRAVRLKAARVMASLACAAVPSAGAEEVPIPARFEPAFFQRHGGRVDLAAFEADHGVAAGVHALDVQRNDRPVGRHRVRFVAPAAGGAATPCVDRGLAEALGIAIARLSVDARRALLRPEACIAFDTLVPGARAVHDPGELALRVSVPQAALVARHDTEIDPAMLDAGIPALRLRYALSATHREDLRHGRDRTQVHLQLDAGANLERWRLRHRSTQSWRPGAPARHNAIATTLEHDLDTLHAQATVGDFHTRGGLFDAFGLRGVRMASDDRMLPPTQVRYAPVVRGIAATNARVQVRQGDTVLRDTTVPAGPFALHDLRPVGAGDALQVRVIEEDGATTTFAVPNAATPGLLRRGHARFSIAAGRWRPARGGLQRGVAEMTWEGGTGDRSTVRAGAQLAGDYAHALAGVAVSTLVGAVSFDLSRSRLTGQAPIAAGSSARIAYAGFLATTRTSIDVAAWRVGSMGFRSLHDAMQPTPATARPRERLRTDIALRQDAQGAGAFSLAWVARRHVARDAQHSLQLGWGRAFAQGRLRVGASFEHTRQAETNTRHGMLSLSVPLRTGSGVHSLHAQARLAQAHGAMQLGAQGPLGEGRATYGIGLLQAHARDRDASTTASASVALSTHAARLGAGLGVSPDARQWSANAEGALLAHRDGFTLAPALGDTVALLRSEHGQGARVLHDPRLHLGRHGRAVVAHLSPYRRNRVGLDPQGADPDVHFAWTERDVVPRAGAVVDVALPSERAPARWLRVVREDGDAPPFAADIQSPSRQTVGSIGREGVAYVRVASDALHLDVHWDDEGERHAFRIALPPSTSTPFEPQPVICATPDSLR